MNSLPPLRSIMQEYGLQPSKTLGQNFILDQNITDKIARSAGDLTSVNVLEIGPGPGGLTRSLLIANAKHITALELDPRCVKALHYLTDVYPERLDVIQADAMEFDFSDLKGPVKVVANLPYNVGTQILIKLLEYLPQISSMTLMFQKEVGERICAQVGTSDYGRLGVLIQWLCDAKMIFDLPPSAFVPAPKVYSTVVHITPLANPRYEASRESLEKVLRVTFNNRRKMLRATLKSILQDPIASLESIQIDPTKRPEELTVQEFCKIANLLD